MQLPTMFELKYLSFHLSYHKISIRLFFKILHFVISCHSIYIFQCSNFDPLISIFIFFLGGLPAFLYIKQTLCAYCLNLLPPASFFYLYFKHIYQITYWNFSPVRGMDISKWPNLNTSSSLNLFLVYLVYFSVFSVDSPQKNELIQWKKYP